MSDFEAAHTNAFIAAATSLPDQTNTENDIMGQHEVVSNGATTDDFDDSWLHRSDCFESTFMDIVSNESATGIFSALRLFDLFDLFNFLFTH
jgi:hypothetical protein